MVKTHAIAFIQFIEGQDGQKHREGPWNEEEEARVNEQWTVGSFFFRRKHVIDIIMIIRQKRREVEASKIREQIERKLSKYEGYIDRLERKAGSQFQPGDEGIFLHFFFLSFLNIF